ncbi:MAG TPA: hypothetical protein VNA28_03000 [Solirubrobacteraceae bacterium]|nr:hypothetical protein [Solirubrobacteraceae bacterium]
MADALDEDRVALIEVLARSGAQFVLIGGAALQSHGQAYATQDIDARHRVCAGGVP